MSGETLVKCLQRVLVDSPDEWRRVSGRVVGGIHCGTRRPFGRISRPGLTRPPPAQPQALLRRGPVLHATRIEGAAQCPAISPGIESQGRSLGTVGVYIVVVPLGNVLNPRCTPADRLQSWLLRLVRSPANWNPSLPDVSTDRPTV